ncbi:TolC family protein [Mucilaginibacter boryungensis]|uniref:TolC family protein n=1 Tax=Mucilaginibacter boryungensis TaxID=768480 RepID=A0ABR9XLD9_9SPHI|nr:TolC family protein [Mucilaginibacter boryungensis]MBE9668202.1 TolC family protein [Mucilaginibacter boryungensis]
MKYLFSIILCAFVFTAQAQDLDYYLNTALKSSPLLKDLNNQILSEKLDSMRLRAGLKPQVTGSSTGTYAPVINGFGYESAITNGQTLNALIGVNQAIIGKNYLNAQLASIKFSKDSLGNTIRISEQDLKKTIVTQYITAYGSLQQYLFNKEVLDLLTTEEGLLKKLTQSNVYRQSDYLTFLVTLKQQQLTLYQARLQYKNDFTTLSYLSGIVDTTIVQLKDPALKRTFPTDPRTSIFYQQFNVDSIRLENNRRLIDYSYKPKLNVFGDAGYNSDFSYQPYKNFGTSFGFTVTVPIYDGGQRKLQYKKLALQEDTRLNYKTFFDKQYRQQIAQLNQQITDNDALEQQIKDEFKYAESLIKVDNKLLETGDVRVADLIIAINNYLSLKNLLKQTNISKLQLINQLNYWNK